MTIPHPLDPRTIDHDQHFSTTRRRLLGLSAGAGVLLGTGAWTAAGSYGLARGGENPFTLGVASGDPAPDGVVLWTRLAPDPLAADGRGGMEPDPVRVHYEVATDERFRRVVRRDSVLATAALAHSVHPEVRGLEPDRFYWYRFRVGDHLSEVGRTKTTPPVRSNPRSLAFAFASCQRWDSGYFTAFDHMAEEDLDLVVHLGDYIYEYAAAKNVRGATLPSTFASETFDLADYRLQYALYKSDPSLRAAHAAHAWVHTFDDHEVENNWADDHSQSDSEPDQDPKVFLQRRAAAFKAMYEHLPYRRKQLPSGPDIRMHRRITYGTLADFTILDTRQHRSPQPCGDGISSTCEERFDDDNTLLGDSQKRWLLKGFSDSPARWQILGNQAPMGQTDMDPAADVTEVWLDPWDGYVAERNKVLAAADKRGVRNLVVITGDRHTNYAMDLKRDFNDPDSPTVGSEFVVTSITSGGDGADVDEMGKTFLAANPHLKFYNAQRGYCRSTVTRDHFTTDFRVVPFVTKPDAPVSTRASYSVRDRRPGVDVT